VAIVHDAVKETIRPHLTLVRVFHAYASVDTPWVAHALSRCTPVRYGRIDSISVPHAATQFVRPHKSRMRQYTTQSLFIQTQLTHALIDSGRGYMLELRIYDLAHSQPSHTIFSTSPNCSAQSPIMPT
jgi:hypothetical protein